MKRIASARRISGFLLAFLILLSSTIVLANAETPSNNRFNVMFVVDASGSMNDSDPDNLRYEAISQFTNLLAAHGNHLGGIVFSTGILSEQKPVFIDSQEDKNQIVQKITSVSPSGWTNTGDALMGAVNNLIEHGDPSLPSVIVFLSDGNTIMGKKEETEVSLNTKAEAIQKARENGIAIYTVCLNSDQTADLSEMKQISSATGGEFREVREPEDLGDVFNSFYNLIYGTSTITIIDEVFPENGVVETYFSVPGIGVEEVNIIIYGQTTSLKLYKPDGTESDTASTPLRSLTMIKITDVIPGTWRIVTTGVPGDRIKINMVYNSNLDVDVSITPKSDAVAAGTDVFVTAVLTSGGSRASSSENYEGYNAELHVLDAYENELQIMPMNVKGDRFEATPGLDIGTYKFIVFVSGSYTSKESDICGPLSVIPKDEPVKEHVNTPPRPIENPVQKTVTIWPFTDNTTTINMADLAEDQEDSTLQYKIISTSFIEGKDFTVSDDVIAIEHYSLSKGAFTIRATDSGGLDCDIEVIITSHNVGLIALIGLGILAVIIAIIIGISLYIAFTRPFRGTVTAQSECDRKYSSAVSRIKKRGRIKLSAFGLDPTGLNYNKSYFQATGKNYIFFYPDKPVTCNGKKEKKIRIINGAEVIISVDKENTKRIHMKFESRIKGNVRRRPPKRTNRR